MHNRRHSAKRKLWEITVYKHAEQHISDSDEDEEEETRKNTRKQYCTELLKTAVENWISHGSSFSCGEEFKSNETCNPIIHSEGETLIETVSDSEDSSLCNSQLSISDVSCCSKRSFCTKQTSQYHFSEDSSDHLTPAAISDITDDSQKNCSTNEQACNIVFSISPPSSPIDGCNLNAKGSKWLSTIPWQPKSQKEPHPQAEHCSDKKKKYVDGGFAAQLHRLQSREKTDKAFWNHQTYDPKSPVHGKESLILKLVQVESTYGTAVCKAVSLKSQHLSEVDNASLTANNTTSKEFYENCIVLLHYEQCVKLNISTGSTVQLFPPWKSIYMTNLTEPVLLCTHFLKVLKKSDHLFTRKCLKQDGDIT